MDVLISTDDIPPADRYSTWLSVACDALGPLDVRIDKDVPVRGEIRAGRLGPFRDALGIVESRVLLIAQAQSRAGDQITRVAIALLVYDRTRSAALTTLVYALTYLPPVLGGVLLSGLADRYPRRIVMVVTDLVRAVLVARLVKVMALAAKTRQAQGTQT